MATATATAVSQLERDKQHLEASYGKQIHAAPHPTYVSAAWARKHPDKYSATAPSGIETAFNIIRAELTGEQTWGLTVDENAPGYVRGVTNTLNWIGSTWGRAVDGAWQATDAAFGFFAWATGTNSADQQLIQAMMDLCGTATTIITAPVKAGMAVGVVNMYPGMRVEFNYATPKAANNINRFNKVGDGNRPGTDYYSNLDSTTSEPQPPGPPSEVDARGVVGDAERVSDYLATVGNSNSL